MRKKGDDINWCSYWMVFSAVAEQRSLVACTMLWASGHVFTLSLHVTVALLLSLVGFIDATVREFSEDLLKADVFGLWVLSPVLSLFFLLCERGGGIRLLHTAEILTAG